MTSRNKLLQDAIELITQLESRTSNLIHIINTIDQNRMAGNDNEAQDLVSAYYNGMLNRHGEDTEQIKTLKRKLSRVL